MFNNYEKMEKVFSQCNEFCNDTFISTVVFADVDKSVESIIVSDELSNVEDTIEDNNLSEFTDGEQIRIISD